MINHTHRNTKLETKRDDEPARAGANDQAPGFRAPTALLPGEISTTGPHLSQPRASRPARGSEIAESQQRAGRNYFRKRHDDSCSTSSSSGVVNAAGWVPLFIWQCCAAHPLFAKKSRVARWRGKSLGMVSIPRGRARVRGAFNHGLFPLGAFASLARVSARTPEQSPPNGGNWP
jgi:hypothetical protein